MTHGTQYAYKVHKCKCEECKAWNAKWHRAYRQRRKTRTGERMVAGKWVMPTDSLSA